MVDTRATSKLDIQKFIRTIRIPLALELINGTANWLLRDNSAGAVLQTFDIVTIIATVAILFYLGWQVATAYEGRPLLKAAGMGLFVWFVSTVVFTGGIGFALSLLSAPQSWGLTGPAVAFVLFAPAAAVVPMLGAFLRTRYRAG